VNTAATAERLRAIELFSTLDDDVLERIADTATEVDCPAGTVLVEPNQKGSGLFLIVDGSVDVDARAGHFELGPGEVVGELALLTADAVRTARVRAATDVKALAISRADFSPLLDEEPRLTRALLDVIARRLALAMTNP
jgi:CRP-like cAMP-binding protein